MSLKPSPAGNNDTLDLTVRFSASVPDLLISFSLSTQPHANTSTLKQIIRTHLPSQFAKNRIRLIHSGKALSDDGPLSTTLKRNISRPPSRAPTPAPYQPQDFDPKGKGKTPIRDPPLPSPALPQFRIYIHCSIGDVVLSASELASEASLANPSQPNQSTTTTTNPGPIFNDAPPLPAPRGFDRLLTSGFTSSEITSLRLQFLSIQSHTHTPDTMPSPTTLRNMEDQWLDTSNSTSTFDLGSTNPDAVTVTGAGGFTDDEAGTLDDMIFGTAMGFFWPIGCLTWGVREEGVWSRRRKMAVVVGVLLNVGLGLMRYTK